MARMQVKPLPALVPHVSFAHVGTPPSAAVQGSRAGARSGESAVDRGPAEVGAPI
jgi:hypothetical protein